MEPLEPIKPFRPIPSDLTLTRIILCGIATIVAMSVLLFFFVISDNPTHEEPFPLPTVTITVTPTPSPKPTTAQIWEVYWKGFDDRIFHKNLCRDYLNRPWETYHYFLGLSIGDDFEGSFGTRKEFNKYFNKQCNKKGG